VESYRTARGSRQRVVAHLGELKGREKSGWAQLAQRLNGKSRPQRSLFDPPHYDETSDDVVLSARSPKGQTRKTIRLRCVTTPDAAQKVLLNRLGLTLPQRLRRIDEVI